MPKKIKKTDTLEEVQTKETESKNQKTLSNDDKMIAAIGYLWILFLVPLLLKRKSRFVQFHAKQGLILFVLTFVLMVINVVPLVGWIVSFFGWIIWFCLMAVGFSKALQGEEWELPYLGGFAKKIDI